MREAFNKAVADELPDEELEHLMDDAFSADPESARHFFKHFEGMFLDPDQRDLLNRSLLVSAVAAFEALLTRLFTFQIQLFPGLLDADARKFSLRELQEFVSLEDARTAAVSDRVDSLMHESFDDWERWLDRTASISLGDLCMDRDAVLELIQRRHIIVHNDGRVSSQYLQKLRTTEPSVDTWLSTPAPYLEHALDQLDALGVGLGGSLAASWFQGEQAEAQQNVHILAFGLLKAERYGCARKLADIGCQLGSGDSELDKMIMVNSWIARKQLDGMDSIRAEVEAWDVSALAPKFAVAKAALQNDFELLFDRELPLAIERGDIELDGLQTWPLFKEVREQEAYDALVAKVSSADPAVE